MYILLFQLILQNFNLIALYRTNRELRDVAGINQFNYEIQSNRIRVIRSDKRIA